MTGSTSTKTWQARRFALSSEAAVGCSFTTCGGVHIYVEENTQDGTHGAELVSMILAVSTGHADKTEPKIHSTYRH